LSVLLLLGTGCGGSGSEEDHFVFDDDNQTIATNPNPPDDSSSEPVDSSTSSNPVAKAPAFASGSGGNFVWKPVSEADGNAVILLPRTSTTSELRLFGPFGEEVGRYQGRTNGNRPTFRFSLPGCAYGLYLQTESNDGDSYFIESPCDRLEF